MAYEYSTLAPEYQKLWDTMHIIRDAAQLQRVSDKIKKYQGIYEAVQKDTGVPWQMVAVIHLREAGEQDIGRWKGVLHNGQAIVGTGRKTTIVPKGQGPFKTWHEAAVHALKMKGFDKIKPWPVSRILWALEPYNGYGYRNKGILSPYLWASTNHQQRGKYVRDGVFDRNVMDTQIGCAALLKFLGVGSNVARNTTAAGAAATVLAGTGAVVSSPVEYWPWIVGGTVAALAVGFLGYSIYKFRNENVQVN